MTKKDKINYNFYYWGPLLFHTKLDDKSLKQVKKLCKKDPKRSFVKNLAGDIKHEYLIDRIRVDEILQPYLTAFRQAYVHWYNKPINQIRVVSSWVNYMQPGDYNPVHVHGDCDFSSVLYIDIPKKLQKEIKEHQSTAVGPGAITFLYGEDTSYATSVLQKKPVTGDIYIFPYGLRHMVNPHKSKCERVSVGINFAIKGGVYDK